MHKCSLSAFNTWTYSNISNKNSIWSHWPMSTCLGRQLDPHLLEISFHCAVTKAEALLRCVRIITWCVGCLQFWAKTSSHRRFPIRRTVAHSSEAFWLSLCPHTRYRNRLNTAIKTFKPCDCPRSFSTEASPDNLNAIFALITTSIADLLTINTQIRPRQIWRF